MENIEFKKTADGSIGLYNTELDEIYHSIEGAQTESVEKFIIPSCLNERSKNSKSLRILDICFGIGYNSKNALCFYKNCDIIIDALEIDGRLVKIAPKIEFYMPEINDFLLGKCSLGGSSINFFIQDARKTVQELNEPYDVIFLDAFAPNKLPTLWSVEFFAQLKRLLKDEGILVTYSSAQPVRKALSLNGFYLGCKIDSKGHSYLTTAALDPKIIENPLCDYDIGLMNTKAGIPYRDKSLNGTADEIFALRQKEVENSTLIGTSRFIKNYSSM